jgi:hypothetical protein
MKYLDAVYLAFHQIIKVDINNIAPSGVLAKFSYYARKENSI